MTYGKTTCQIPKKMIPFHFWSPLINRFTSEVYLELKRGEVQVDGNFCELKGVSIASTLQFHHLIKYTLISALFAQATDSS